MDFFSGPAFLQPVFILGNILGLLIGFPLHEYAHGRMAVYLGDRTPYFQQRLTLDPRSHIDPLGLIFGIIFGFGWTRPTPINSWSLSPDRKRGMLLVASAGPLANLGVATVLGIILTIFVNIGMPDFLSFIVLWALRFNLVMCFFNIVPLHPLDGWQILLAVVSPQQEFELKQYEQYAVYGLMILLLTGILGAFFSPFIRAFIDIFV